MTATLQRRRGAKPKPVVRRGPYVTAGRRALVTALLANMVDVAAAETGLTRAQVRALIAEQVGE